MSERREPDPQPTATVTAERARRIIGAFGDAGRVWLDELPQLIDDVARDWRLTLAPPFAMSYGYVAPAVRADGSRVVLKLRVPDSEARDEIEALRAYDGAGAVRLLAHDAVCGALLLERAEPGTMLADATDIDDEAKTRIAAGVLRRLWREPPQAYAFPTLAGWARALGDVRARYNGATGPLPAPLFERAERVFAGELAAGEPPLLLHGDLHHENILRAEREPWLAVDPHGVIGDRAYEPGAFLRNHLLGLPEPRAALARRVDVFVEELGMERERLVGWGIATNVLSACWSLLSHDDGWQDAIAVCEMLAEMR
jgi:streptomycin 6-kinase